MFPRDAQISSIGCGQRRPQTVSSRRRYIACVGIVFNKIRMYRSKFRAAQNSS
jgi:hypothetical protein